MLVKRITDASSMDDIAEQIFDNGNTSFMLNLTVVAKVLFISLAISHEAYLAAFIVLCVLGIIIFPLRKENMAVIRENADYFANKLSLDIICKIIEKHSGTAVRFDLTGYDEESVVKVLKMKGKDQITEYLNSNHDINYKAKTLLVKYSNVI